MALVNITTGAAKTNGEGPKKKYIGQVTPEQKDYICQQLGVSNGISDTMLGQNLVAAALYFASMSDKLQQQAVADFKGSIPKIAKR